MHCRDTSKVAARRGEMRMKNEELASITGQGRYRRVEVRRVVNAPIEKVWNAITRADGVAQWWASGEIDAREGGRVKLGDTDACDDAGPGLDGIVKVCLAPHVFEYSWNEAYEPAQGLVRFDLVEIDDNTTQVTLVQTILAADIVPAAAGWHEIVERLGRYIDSGQTVPIPDNDGRFRELQAVYEKVVG